MACTTKTWLIVGAALVVAGLIFFAAVMTACHWDFAKLSTVRYVTNTHTVNEAFTDISIETDTADIFFVPADDGVCKVVCHEQEKLKHFVALQDGTLTLRAVDGRKWYDFIGINFGSPKLTIYLPEEDYDILTVRESTGNVTLPREFGFKQMDISISTGDIDIAASISGSAKLRTTTGDICVEGITAGSLELSASTGHITVSDVTCLWDLNTHISTGKVYLTDVNCRNLTSKGTTGDLFLTNTVATGTFSIERNTGDIRFDRCDAAEIFAKTSTGDVTGSLLSDKIFMVQTDTGKIHVPQTVTGGKCQITTDTGDIKLSIEP